MFGNAFVPLANVMLLDAGVASASIRTIVGRLLPLSRFSKTFIHISENNKSDFGPQGRQYNVALPLQALYSVRSVPPSAGRIFFLPRSQIIC